MAPATATTDSLWVRGLRLINSLLHLPGVYELSWLLYWVNVNLLGPLWAVLLLAWSVADGLGGKWWPVYNKPKPGQAILITGCDSGFGYEAALRFAKAGWIVYAGCLSDAGMAALTTAAAAGPGKLVALRMDVTKSADVEAVVKRMVDDGVSLYALINNAGIGWGVPFDWASDDGDYRKIMEVNFFAVVAVTRACLPLLKQSKGRIVTIGSVAGLAAAPLMSAYSAAKHAVEAWMTAIRVELAPFGIKVVTLNPCFHSTKIATNARPHLERAYHALPADMREQYGDKYLDGAVTLLDSFIDGCWEPVHVVNKIVQATTISHPMSQYIVGMDGRFALVPLVNAFPMDFQMWISMKTYFRNLIPAAASKGFAPQAPTNGGGNGKGKKGSKKSR